MENNTCKICRRQGQKLFLKGERCLSPKCPFIKRPYPPGQKKKRRGGNFSEYAKELKEKQKLQKLYGLSEGQFRKYVKGVLQKRGKVEDASSILLKKLESRLDNVVFRAGFAKSRREARQLVSHRHFLVNSKPVNIASFAVKKGDLISLKENKQTKTLFKNMAILLKNQPPINWLKLDLKKMTSKVEQEPEVVDVGAIVDIPSIFEFYSR